MKITIQKYQQDVSVNKAKGLSFPTIRGTWLPRLDLQVNGGFAINWAGIRLKIVAGC